MIHYFQGNQRRFYPRETDQMFRLRADQFHRRLGWDVTVKDGWETDKFDDMNPIYLVSKNPLDGVVGTLRFLPTTGQTMLSDVFARYFDPSLVVQSPLIWECTRIATSSRTSRVWRTPTGKCQAMAELMQGGLEVAAKAGIAQVVGIYDGIMERIYKRLGWAPETIGSSNSEFPGDTIYVGLWDVSEENLKALQEKSGLTGSVLA